ncbi:hypothetical protein HN51_045120 [Arachis hypogaea]
MGGGAWPFLVGGAICLVNSVNERDLSLLTSYVEVTLHGQLLRGTMAAQATEIIAIVGLQRGIPSKRESSARVDYVPALCTHRPSLLPIEWSGEVFGSRRRGRIIVDAAQTRIDARTSPQTPEAGKVRPCAAGALSQTRTKPRRGKRQGSQTFLLSPPAPETASGRGDE